MANRYVTWTQRLTAFGGFYAPGRYGIRCPRVSRKRNSVWRCFRRWCERGLWAWVLARLDQSFASLRQILMLDASHMKAHQDATRSTLSAEEQSLGKTKGGRNTKLHAVVNQAGRAVALRLLPGPKHESQDALAVLPEDLRETLVLADKGYDSGAIRAEIVARGGGPNIPSRCSRKLTVLYDNVVARRRRRVENFFCRIKRYRRIAMRSDQLPQTYPGFVTFAAIIDYLR